VFIRKIDWMIYHPNMVFEDRIHGSLFFPLLK
jgi:hypothetical protein